MARKNSNLEDIQTMAGQGAPDKHMNIDMPSFRKKILDWYDMNARPLPWRATPELTPNPYHVWLSEIMLQQTVVAAVIPYFQKFVEKWPRVHDLAKASNDEVMAAWAGLGYYARARNLHKCAIEIAENHDGHFPQSEKALKQLPGIGDYTSAAIRSIAFNKPSVVVDGNIERVISRLFCIETPLPDSKPLIKHYAGLLAHERADRPGDYAQALMDIGATICIPKAPRCHLCPVSHDCEGKNKGIAAALPYKNKKKAKPQRYGYIYLIENNDKILLYKRPEKGLLGGMLSFPSNDWVETDKSLSHPEFMTDIEALSKHHNITHSFTHFDLKLLGFKANIHEKVINSDHDYVWLDRSAILEAGLPTVFKKFAKLVI